MTGSLRSCVLANACEWFLAHWHATPLHTRCQPSRVAKYRLSPTSCCSTACPEKWLPRAARGLAVELRPHLLAERLALPVAAPALAPAVARASRAAASGAGSQARPQLRQLQLSTTATGLVVWQPQLDAGVASSAGTSSRLTQAAASLPAPADATATQSVPAAAQVAAVHKLQVPAPGKPPDKARGCMTLAAGLFASGAHYRPPKARKTHAGATAPAVAQATTPSSTAAAQPALDHSAAVAHAPNLATAAPPVVFTNAMGGAGSDSSSDWSPLVARVRAATPKSAGQYSTGAHRHAPAVASLDTVRARAAAAAVGTGCGAAAACMIFVPTATYPSAGISATSTGHSRNGSAPALGLAAAAEGGAQPARLAAADINCAAVQRSGVPQGSTEQKMLEATVSAAAGPVSFKVPARASPHALLAAVAALLPPNSLPVGATAVVGKPVPTTGQFSGHCAFVSLIRSSGAQLDATAELRLVMALRGLAVADLCVRLAAEPSFGSLLAATAELTLDDGNGGVGTEDVAAGVGRKRRRASGPPATSAAATAGLPSAIAAYLRGQLAATPTAASQYAGPLELGALARRLRRRVIVLVEEDNHADHGGVFTCTTGDGLAAGSAGAAVGLPIGAGTGGCPSEPLVLVATRRQHTYPVTVRAGAVAASSDAALRSGAGSQQQPLELLTVRNALAAAVAQLAGLAATSTHGTAHRGAHAHAGGRECQQHDTQAHEPAAQSLCVLQQLLAVARAAEAAGGT
jgi:hypothetical protein